MLFTLAIALGVAAGSGSWLVEDVAPADESTTTTPLMAAVKDCLWPGYFVADFNVRESQVVAVSIKAPGQAQPKAACYREKLKGLVVPGATTRDFRASFRIVDTVARDDAKLGDASEGPPDKFQPVASPVPAFDAKGYGAALWGDSRATVARKQNAQVVSDGLMSTAKIAGLDAAVAYFFIDDKLSSVGVVFQNEFVNNLTYLEKHLELRELLETKYGRALRVGDIWTGDGLYRDSPARWGMAVETGRLQRASLWDLPSATIMLSTRGENFKQSTMILYSSKEFAEKNQNRVREDNLSGL